MKKVVIYETHLPFRGRSYKKALVSINCTRYFFRLKVYVRWYDYLYEQIRHNIVAYLQ